MQARELAFRLRCHSPRNATDNPGMVILNQPVAGATESSLARFLSRAKRAVGLRGAVTVLITTSRELRALNRNFRHEDAATDVLSFPSDMIAPRHFAGDIAISADIAERNARRLGHPLADEVKILALHGLLHLAGYDHDSDHGEMARWEALLRKKLGLPVALIERNTTAHIAKPVQRQPVPHARRARRGRR